MKLYQYIGLLCYEIKKADPNIMVGVLCGSWAKDVPLNHPSVNRVHIMDHWKHNRSMHHL